ncbi:MAG: SPOR domain-containing protein [Methylovulum sp.]|nr:SPOR domain-containing protein [Methylovulum sp.]
MVEHDTFTYSMKKLGSGQSHAIDHSLITQERKQKLELLIHLISNLTQTLVICGPQGIGKTTLLHVLHERKIDSWLYCLVQGSADLSFEAIQERVNLAVKPDKQSGKSQDFSQSANNNKKIVLLIDNAGALVPGLITAIIQYAWTNPLLRVVFVLTHDELHVKNSTDQIVDDCHFVEIPPLSEKQCGDFLQQLSTKPWARLSLNTINDSMIRNVYRHTHGIPGRIIAELPGLAKGQKSINSLWLLSAAVAGLVVIALGIQWYSADKKNKAVEDGPVVLEQEVGTAQTQQSQWPETPASSPVSASDNILDQYTVKDVAKQAEPVAAVVAEQKLESVVAGAGDKQQATESDVTVVDAGLQAVAPTAVDADASPVEQDTVIADAQSDGVEWLKAQPPGNFTLQVMVLSKEQSIRDFRKKHPSLAPELIYTKTAIGGKEKFLLFYGSFNSSASAYKAKQALPSEFRHSLVKKISAIKK